MYQFITMFDYEFHYCTYKSEFCEYKTGIMKDFSADNTDDLQIKNGDFVVGHSNEQHQKHILLANKGEYKEFPEVGVGIAQMIADDRYTEILIETKKQLEYDGMEIDDISLDEYGKMLIEGIYKED